MSSRTRCPFLRNHLAHAPSPSRPSRTWWPILRSPFVHDAPLFAVSSHIVPPSSQSFCTRCPLLQSSCTGRFWQCSSRSWLLLAALFSLMVAFGSTLPFSILPRTWFPLLRSPFAHDAPPSSQYSCTWCPLLRSLLAQVAFGSALLTHGCLGSALPFPAFSHIMPSSPQLSSLPSSSLAHGAIFFTVFFHRLLWQRSSRLWLLLEVPSPPQHPLQGGCVS